LNSSIPARRSLAPVIAPSRHTSRRVPRRGDPMDGLESRRLACKRAQFRTFGRRLELHNFCGIMG
jgi:hypothetical protein